MHTLYPPQILANTSRRFPHKRMLTYGKKAYSYQEGRLIVERLAFELSQLNVKGKVLVSMPNSPEFIFAVFALFRIGAIPIPLNPGYTPYEMDEIIKDSGASATLTRENEVVCARFIDSQSITRFLLCDLLTVKDSRSVERKFRPSQKAIMFYTSGSTGQMKAVVHTFASLCANPYSLVDLMSITSEDTYFIGVPLFHLFGFSPGMITAIMGGAEIVISDLIGSVGVIDRIQNQKVTVLLCNATMLRQLIYLLERRRYEISSLRIVMISGSISPKELLATAIKKFCRNTLNLFGTTETGIISQTLPNDDILHLMTTVGRPLPGIDIRILDENKRPITLGEAGAISCKTYGLFKEYHKMPSLTSKVKDAEGWYDTGDMGKLDESGYLTIVGRRSEMILKSGFNIYPREVELALLQHPKIGDAAVVGIPDPTYGEIVRAVIIKKENEDPTKNEILDHCRERLVYYKIPDQIVFAQEFPMTSTGKIRRNELKKLSCIQ